MPTWIALFRGINVGGKHMLPMAKLKVELESLKLTNVRTYIQSGNVLFDCGRAAKAKLTQMIVDLVDQHHGFRPAVLLLTRDELQRALDQNPYPDATSQPTTLHFYFLASPASKPNLKALEQLKLASESFKLTDAVLYLHTPDGLGRSKLAAAVEKHLGVTTTARNYRTVEKLNAMCA